MADKTEVHIGENSPEQVAYKLMVDIFHVEGVNLFHAKSTTREKILSTYWDCLRVVGGAKPGA